MAQAQRYIAAGYTVVVDLDLENFFDRVNHDGLMARVAARVSHKRVRKLIRAFLKAGVMEDGLVSPVDEGTPQGGPLKATVRSARRCCAPGSAIARSAGRWRRFHASGVGSRVRVASTLSRLASVPRSSFLTSRAPRIRPAVERLPPLPGVADIKSEWPRSNRNQWPTSFRNRRPTSPGICISAQVARVLMASMPVNC